MAAFRWRTQDATGQGEGQRPKVLAPQGERLSRRESVVSTPPAGRVLRLEAQP